MLEVSEAARARLAHMLEQEAIPEEIAVRLVREPAGIALRGDSKRPGDETFQHGGRTVLVLDAVAAGLLSTSRLYIDGAELALRHPKATTSGVGSQAAQVEDDRGA